MKLTNWEKETNRVAYSFRKKYFTDATDYYWVGGDIGGVYAINDYFFDFNDIVDFIRYKYTPAEFDIYIDYKEKNLGGEIISIKNFKKLK